MKNAFIDINGVLTSWGYADSNNDDALIMVPDDFDMTPGAVKTSDGGQTWVPVPPEHATANAATKSALQAAASQAMTPLLLSLQLGNATDAETALAKLWQTYSRALQGVDPTASSPDWPVLPT